MTYTIKGVFVRFDFDNLRISQIHRQVKNKATRTPHEVYYIHIIFSEEVEPIIENEEDTIPEVQSIEVEDWETMFDEEVSQEALPHKVVEPKNNI